ncbi:MAG: TonB-dependent receptor plug domain-containing protein [Opitutales bacterium]|nr:TonB-dependent receptor plug domain-containing protein [Opitutales bacterium]
MSHLTRTPVSRKLSYLISAVGIGTACFNASAQAQDEASTAEDLYVMDPFTVSADDSTGYIASNSISGTRTKTAIRDIPLNIQVFTEELAADLIVTSQVDLERYNASLVNGGDDPHSNNVIQQAYNGFIFRGFVQNWSLRDGVRQYDPVDAQGISRVEIVKGPVAAMYGVTYPGGVMNTITKSAIQGANFADAMFSIADHGEWRATLDANVSGESEFGAFSIRYNGAYQETKDGREHSDGKIEYNQINVTLAPTKSTTIKLLAEYGYREQPNGLGYFTTSEVDENGVGIGNSAEIPLQVTHPDIDWDWNWATGNMRSCDNTLYKAEITQKFSDNFSINAYALYSTRDQVDSDGGLDGNGGGGSGGSWAANSNTGWINPNTANEKIVLQNHYIDWCNQNRAYGLTGLLTFDIGGIKNTVTGGAHFWEETFYSHRGSMPSTSPNYVILDVVANLDGLSFADTFPPSDYYINTSSGQHEESENEYYFASLQSEFLDGRLRTTAAINYTELDLKSYANIASDVISNHTKDDKVSPLFGAMFDITKDISVFGVYSTSLFPTTDKNDFEEQLPPVEGESYEFGFKFDIIENKLSGTISYYIIEQTGGSQRDPNAINKNKIEWDGMTDAERAIAFPGLTRDELKDRNGQLGDLIPGLKQESTGFEVDLVYQPMKNWQIMLSYAHNDVEIKESVDKTQIGRIPNSGHIEDQLSFLTKYSFEDGPAKGLYIGLGGQWADGAFQGYVGDVARYNPSTFYLESFAGYNFKTFGRKSSIQLNVKNITEVDEFVGWKATGSSKLATERYEVPTDIRYTLSYSISF